MFCLRSGVRDRFSTVDTKLAARINEIIESHPFSRVSDGKPCYGYTLIIPNWDILKRNYKVKYIVDSERYKYIDYLSNIHDEGQITAYII